MWQSQNLGLQQKSWRCFHRESICHARPRASEPLTERGVRVQIEKGEGRWEGGGAEGGGETRPDWTYLVTGLLEPCE